MGIIKQGILGGFSGKVGSVVGTSWKGRAVMKAMPLSVANPRTTAQMTQRSKFNGCVLTAKRLLGGTIALLDNPFAGNVSGYNRFMSRNVKAFTSSNSLLPDDLVISEGSLGGKFLQPPVAWVSSGMAMNVEADDISSPFNLSSDKVVVAVYNKSTFTWLNTGTIVGVRTDLNYNIDFSSPVVNGNEIVVYISTVRADKKYVSTSMNRTYIVAGL